MKFSGVKGMHSGHVLGGFICVGKRSTYDGISDEGWAHSACRLKVRVFEKTGKDDRIWVKNERGEGAMWSCIHTKIRLGARSDLIH